MESEKVICDICNSNEATKTNGTINCPFCGDYIIDANSFYTLKAHIDEEKFLKLRYVFKKNSLLPIAQRIKRNILGDTVVKEADENYSVPSLLEKIELVMDYIEKETTFISEKVAIDAKTLFPLFFCKNNHELDQMINHLKEVSYIKFKISDDIKAKFETPIPIKAKEKPHYENSYYVLANTIKSPLFIT